MKANSRKRDTRPERAVRSLLHSHGFRFRVDHKIGTGRAAPRPDITFTRAKIAIFIDGCYWHGCPAHGVRPRTNSDYWAAKIARNKQRDAQNDVVLVGLGWRVIRIWEHEDPVDATTRIETALRHRSGSSA